MPSPHLPAFAVLDSTWSRNPTPSMSLFLSLTPQLNLKLCLLDPMIQLKTSRQGSARWFGNWICTLRLLWDHSISSYVSIGLPDINQILILCSPILTDQILVSRQHKA